MYKWIADKLNLRQVVLGIYHISNMDMKINTLRIISKFLKESLPGRGKTVFSQHSHAICTMLYLERNNKVPVLPEKVDN